MSRYINMALLIVTALSLLSIGYFVFVPPEPPIEYVGGDFVIPQKVKAGGTILITRHYRIVRSEKIVVTRRIAKGNCERGCTIIDMASSDLVNKPGTFSGARELIVPTSCTPGIWSLEFQAQWEDRLGRTRVILIPPLMIEVIE